MSALNCPLWLALLPLATACGATETDEPLPIELERAPIQRELAASAGHRVVGYAEAPLPETDQQPRYELVIVTPSGAARRPGILALDATIDAETRSLIWLDTDGTLWDGPLDSAPAGRRAIDDDVILGLATSRGRLAYARRIDGPETAPFLIDLRTRRVRALDDAPGPDEIAGFTPSGDDVLLLSGRTGLSSLFAVGVDHARVEQLTNVDARPTPAPPAHATSADGEVAFRFPGSDEHRTHYYITAYRDLTGSGGGLEDWGCGTKTYDGHRGTDMGVGSFPGMDAGRDVVAAAPGTVTYVNDGVFDRCTSGACGGGGGFGNYVRIEHADGKVTYYGHLKKFSITVAVGDTVACGQKIGQVGSSGNSTGPHLHFEPRVSGVSDDPFSGPCGGPISWWVEQGPYLGLPEPICPDAPPAHPLLSMDAGLDAIDGQAPDAHPEGDSAGIFDLEADQTVTARFYVTDDVDASVSPNVVLGVEAPGGYLTVVEWQLFDDYPGNACGGDWCPNDANDNPANPPRALPGEAFELHLNALSPGESKMLVLTLRHAAATDGQAPHAPVRVWVKQVEGSYAKPTFDAAPDNVDAFQTFNDGDLKQELLLDTWSTLGEPDEPGEPGEPDEPGEPGDPDGPGEPDDTTAEGAMLSGGCAVTDRDGAPLLSLMLIAGAIARARRRRKQRKH